MPLTTHLLVVASRTAGADELVSYLTDRAKAAPLRVTLVVPVGLGGRDAARARMEHGVQTLRDAGLDATAIVAGDGDPLHAVLDAYEPARHDEIVIVTLPERLSHWLGCDLPQRVARITGALVHHIETREAPLAVPR